jgi:hypothetical protein
MNLDVNIIVLVGQLVLSGFLVWLAFKKAPAERASYNGASIKSYAEAARIKGEENLKLEEEILQLNHRLDIVERKKYKIAIEFTLGDTPEIGKVIIEPIVALTAKAVV